MKPNYLLFLLIIVIVNRVAYAQDVCPIIPLPNEYKSAGAVFEFAPQTIISAKEPSFQSSLSYFLTQLPRYSGIQLTTKKGASANSVVLQRETGEKIPPEGYAIQMSSKRIIISAADNAGAFYGVQSLLQLMAASEHKDNTVLIKCWSIKDAPAYGWRGVMLDESRHFFGKAEVKKILDQMALYKLNRFHWHLTDEPAWRLEIAAYPKLALVGGVDDPKNPAAVPLYYSKKDIAEIVRYATERHIMVIPEIDMPGHASAANRAYPEYSGGGSARHPEFTFNPGKEETYQYLANILKEVNAMFPSHMIHLGGDEVSYGNEKWKDDPSIQQLMKSRGLTTMQQVEEYFIKRMADTVIKLRSKALGWDEITHAGLVPEKTIVFWWRHEQTDQLDAALSKKIPVVLCPRLPMYFDFVQDTTHTSGRKFNTGKYNSSETVYNFSHEMFPAAKANRNLILGMQANLWTETVVTPQRLEYLLFPRICALAEAAWTTASKKDYRQFETRLAGQFPLFEQAKILYYNPLKPESTPEILK